MALQKEVISNNGAKATYHRLCSVTKEYKTLSVILHCYTEELYREKEKEVFNTMENLEAMTERYSVLSGTHPDIMTDAEKEEFALLKQEIDEYEKYLQNGPFYLFDAHISLPWDNNDDGITFADIYVRIKETQELFKDAVDC